MFWSSDFINDFLNVVSDYRTSSLLIAILLTMAFLFSFFFSVGSMTYFISQRDIDLKLPSFFNSLTWQFYSSTSFGDFGGSLPSLGDLLFFVSPGKAAVAPSNTFS